MMQESDDFRTVVRAMNGALTTEKIDDIYRATTNLTPLAQSGKYEEAPDFLLILAQKLLCSAPDVPVGLDATLVVMEQSTRKPLLMAMAACFICDYHGRLPPDKALRLVYKATRLAMTAYEQQNDKSNQLAIYLRESIQDLGKTMEELRSITRSSQASRPDTNPATTKSGTPPSFTNG